MRTTIVVAAAACMLFAMVMQPFALEHERRPIEPGALSQLPGMPLSQEECAAVKGGDVRMKLNGDRTKLTVNVIDNEYEARLGRIPPVKVLEYDVHNRIVDTVKAPFMPATKEGRELAASGQVTTKPSSFPAGYWSVTAVKPRDDKYGPYFIATNAVGQVDLYRNNGAGNYQHLGTGADIGYGLHANTNPFSVSKSYGCIVMKQQDVAELAGILSADRRQNSNAVQKIYVPSGRAGER